MKAEDLFNKHAVKNMIQWNLNGFKKSHNRLFRSIIGAIEEAQQDKEIKLGATVYHKEIYEGKEPMEIVGIRKDEVELEGDYSGGTHSIRQKTWVGIDGLLFEKSDK